LRDGARLDTMTAGAPTILCGVFGGGNCGQHGGGRARAGHVVVAVVAGAGR